jgi:hypothetical protein
MRPPMPRGMTGSRMTPRAGFDRIEPRRLLLIFGFAASSATNRHRLGRTMLYSAALVLRVTGGGAQEPLSRAFFGQ